MQEAIIVKNNTAEFCDQDCLWVSAGEVSRRNCLHGFHCARCEFHQVMTDLGLSLESLDQRLPAAA